MHAWSEAIAGARSSDPGNADDLVDRLIVAAPTSLDLTDPAADAPLEAAADLLVNLLDRPALSALDVRLADEGGPLALRVATKLGLSKWFITQSHAPRYLSGVFAVYQEHERIRTRQEHASGEDFLNRKLRQLRWLFDGYTDWELVVVDDGCPDGSGHIAMEIIERGGHQAHARVLFLQDAIEIGLEVADGLKTPDDSRKGGSILYGMWDALQTRRDGHVVAFTDADLSTPLGQCGLLLEALASGASCAAGSRREPTSAVVKAGGRNDRGKLFIYWWKRMIEPLGEIVDSQCGFKAFDAAVLDEIVIGNVERKFAFDIELLLRTALQDKGGIAKVAISWIDSEALSTTTDLQPYVPMLQAIAMMYRSYLPSDPAVEAFAVLADRLTAESWDRLLDNIPIGITSREPREFVTFSGVEAGELANAASLDLLL